LESARLKSALKELRALGLIAYETPRLRGAITFTLATTCLTLATTRPTLAKSRNFPDLATVEEQEKKHIEGTKEEESLRLSGGVPPQGSASLSAVAGKNRHGENDSIAGVAAAWSAQPNLPRIRNLSDKRRKVIATRLKDDFFAEHYGAAIGKVAAAAFCRGENERHWRTDFDWFLKPDVVTRIIEGKYDDGAAGGDLPANLVIPEPGRPTVDDVNRAAWERKMAERAEREAR
jgi:hypothetical protein